MPTVTDLFGLPLTVPELANEDETRLGDTFAIYITAHFSNAERVALLLAINTPIWDDPGDEDPEPAAAIPEHADAEGKSLQDVVARHVTTILGRDGTIANGLEGFHPTTLIAVTDVDWRTRGVLLVFLNDSGYKGDVFAFRHPAQHAAAILTDIEAGNNSSWEAADNAAAEIEGAEIPEPSVPPSPSTAPDKAVWAQQWSKESMGFFGIWCTESREGGPVWEELNGGPSCWDYDINDWPCQHVAWLRLVDQAGRRLLETTERERKIAMFVALQPKWIIETPGVRFHKGLFILVDEMDLGKGVWICDIRGKEEITEESAANGPVRLERMVHMEKVGASEAAARIIAKAAEGDQLIV